MNYRFKAVDEFWAVFYKLPAKQKESTRKAWEIFKRDPFDPRLKTHKIEYLSNVYRKTIYSAAIESNLRVVFCLEGNVVITLNIGTHDIYKS